MNPVTPGVSASNPPMPLRRRGPRGVQLEEVVEAADALLARGLKPTIERVRQHLGGGSPNTISPLLDEWFVALSARLAGVPTPVEDDLPTELRSAWHHAKHEARTLAHQALQAERLALEEDQAKLRADQTALIAREAQWAGAQAVLKRTLAETHDASEAQRSQLAATQKELADLRRRAAQETDTLREEVAQLRQGNESLRGEHARLTEAHEAAWRQERERLQAREAAHEKRFLVDVDRARQSVKALEADMAKEKKRRVQLEDASGAERASLGAALQEARGVERELRKELQAQAVVLSRAQVNCQALDEKIGAIGRALAEERIAHRAARTALAQALAAVGQRIGKRPPKRGAGAG